MQRHSAVAICASSVLAVGFAILTHQLAHVLAGWLGGGAPTLITATEVRGDFRSLGPAGYVALGASGSLVNVLFCGLGWWVQGRRSITAECRLSAWFFFAVNGMLVTTKMLGEAVAGFGDWMMILRPLPSTTYPRVLVAMLGIVGVFVMVRRAGVTLARLVPSGEPPQRATEARRLVLVGALASGILALGAGVANPIGTTRGILLALGAGLGPFLPLLFAARIVRRTATSHADAVATGTWPWFLAAGAMTLVTWFVFGPGIELSHVLS